MLYCSLNNLSIDKKIESLNSITSMESLSPSTIRIKLIKLNENVFYVVNGDNSQTKAHELHILNYNETTN